MQVRHTIRSGLSPMANTFARRSVWSFERKYLRELAIL